MAMDTSIAAPIGLFLNSSSGNGKGSAIAHKLTGSLDGRGIDYILFKDSWPTDPGAISAAWIIGGDGTVNYYLNHYRENKFPIAVFPAGTGNDIHAELYGSCTLEEQVERILHATIRKIDLGSCNDKVYINSSGIGFDGEVLKSMGAIRTFGGHLGYLAVVVKNIFSYKEPFFHIKADGNNLDGSYLLCSINNSTRTGGGFIISPKAMLDDKLLDLVLCNALPVWKRLRYLPVIEKGKHTTLPFIKYLQASSIVVSCDKTLWGQLDGELIQGTEFHFKVIPAALGVLA